MHKKYIKIFYYAMHLKSFFWIVRICVYITTIWKFTGRKQLKWE
jgi:hypothetical protein